MQICAMVADGQDTPFPAANWHNPPSAVTVHQRLAFTRYPQTVVRKIPLVPPPVPSGRWQTLSRLAHDNVLGLLARCGEWQPEDGEIGVASLELMKADLAIAKGSKLAHE